jgi:hypothetical protein
MALKWQSKSALTIYIKKKAYKNVTFLCVTAFFKYELIKSVYLLDKLISVLYLRFEQEEKYLKYWFVKTSSYPPSSIMEGFCL